MADKIATRQAYGEALIELVEKNDKVVVLDADLANATQTCKVAKAHPEKFYNCGIAEANMVDIAAGMSTMGLIPYCSSFAMFAAGRAYEQIRNSIAYPHFNVKICATHAGVSVGEDGGSHQSVTKYAEACGKVITVEEHSVIGGLGDAVADVLMGKVNCKFHKIGVNDRFGQSGKAADVLREYGLTADQIAETVKVNI